MRQMQDTKQDKRNPTLPTNLLSSFGWAYRYVLGLFVIDFWAGGEAGLVSNGITAWETLRGGYASSRLDHALLDISGSMHRWATV